MPGWVTRSPASGLCHTVPSATPATLAVMAKRGAQARNQPMNYRPEPIVRIHGRRKQAMNRYVLRVHRGICYLCNLPGAVEVDHLVPLAAGGADDVSNMRPVHSVCHEAKTRSEAPLWRRAPPRARPPEPHPGLIKEAE